jgi:hypothetical protein
VVCPFFLPAKSLNWVLLEGKKLVRFCPPVQPTTAEKITRLKSQSLGSTSRYDSFRKYLEAPILRKQKTKNKKDGAVLRHTPTKRESVSFKILKT